MFFNLCVGSMYSYIENRWFVQLLKITNIFDIDTSRDISPSLSRRRNIQNSRIYI